MNKKMPNKKTAKKEKGVPVRIKTHTDKKGGHPHVILEDFKDGKKDMHVSVGLSTKKTKGKGSKNYALEKSPLNDGKTSYMRRQGTVDVKENYHKPRAGNMTPKDFERAKEYGAKAKKSFLRKKCKKNSNSVPTHNA